MKKRHTSPNSHPSKVLLVCVYDTLVLQLNNQIIYARFAPFGSIIKILIFERGQVTKFFIEFACLLQAENAKTALDGTKLYETICKMSIYYSNFRSVDLKHQTTEGLSLQPMLQMPIDSYLRIYQSQLAPYTIPQQNNCYQVSYFEFLPTTKLIIDKQSYEFKQESPLKHASSAGELNNNLLNSIDSKIQNDIDWLLRSGQKKQSLKQVQVLRGTNLFRQKEQSCYICFELTTQLLIRQVYNLFSNFGNISFIKQTKKQIFIKFRNHQHALHSRDLLQGYTIRNNLLNIQIMSQNRAALPIEDQYAQITYYDHTFDRLIPDNTKIPIQPTQTLYVSSLDRAICKVGELKYIFQEFGPIDYVQITGRKQPNRSALIRYTCIQDSINALSQLHESSICGRKILICFGSSPLN